MTDPRWKVTIFNQAAMSSHVGRGNTRAQAFVHAITSAGEPWLMAGNRDILTGLRVLFYDHLMRDRFYNGSKRYSASDPRGFSVMVKRLRQ